MTRRLAILSAVVAVIAGAALADRDITTKRGNLNVKFSRDGGGAMNVDGDMNVTGTISGNVNLDAADGVNINKPNVLSWNGGANPLCNDDGSENLYCEIDNAKKIYWKYKNPGGVPSNAYDFHYDYFRTVHMSFGNSVQDGLPGIWLGVDVSNPSQTPSNTNFLVRSDGTDVLWNTPPGYDTYWKTGNDGAYAMKFRDGKLSFSTDLGADNNQAMGTATLSGGTVNVNTTKVATGDRIWVSRNATGGTLGHLSAPTSAIVNGTRFTINSSSGSDTSTVNWWLIGKY